MSVPSIRGRVSVPPIRGWVSVPPILGRMIVPLTARLTTSAGSG